jgi:hypothetical protein
LIPVYGRTRFVIKKNLEIDEKLREIIKNGRLAIIGRKPAEPEMVATLDAGY